ncbi:MAG: hypothetical protein H6744_16060 [Deltaproteobacteria bacterium]|nr:hypothetical protein [Deltaproteobacteria bacterium]MCB9788197.1 hypothetical protein [Deltaproteobacteria bacterium]
MRARDADLADIEAVNARFREEARRFGLRYRCSSCAHVDARLGDCSLGYPNDTLRGAVRALEPDGQLTFCKYFELGESEVE